MGRPRGIRIPIACLLALLAVARAPEAAVIVHSDPADTSFLPKGSRSDGAISILGAATTAGEAGSRTIVYVFRLPESDTGLTELSRADFTFGVAPKPNTMPVRTAPSNYGIDLYAIPARNDPAVLSTDLFFGPQSRKPASDKLITEGILPRNQPFAVGDVSISSDAATDLARFLNDQYGTDGSGVGKYVFLRLNTDTEALAETSGGYVYMSEANAGRPVLTLTFVPEPSTAFAGASVLALATLRRRTRFRY